MEGMVCVVGFSLLSYELEQISREKSQSFLAKSVIFAALCPSSNEHVNLM